MAQTLQSVEIEGIERQGKAAEIRRLKAELRRVSGPGQLGGRPRKSKEQVAV
jgi:hypothetical protein